MKDMHWELNEREVSSEVIDGELIVMHLKTGKYYSSAGTGPLVWGCLVSGMSADATCDFVAARCGVPSGSIKADVAEFIASLMREQLLHVAGAAGVAGAPPDPTPRPAPDIHEYSKPELHVYSDMKDLLLLDPIHDVSEDGWPMRPTADKA